MNENLWDLLNDENSLSELEQIDGMKRQGRFGNMHYFMKYNDYTMVFRETKTGKYTLHNMLQRRTYIFGDVIL